MKILGRAAENYGANSRALVGEEIGRHDLAAAWTLENPLDWAFFCCRPPSKSAT